MQTLLPLEGQAEDALDDKIGRIWGVNSNHIVLKMAAVKVKPPFWQYEWIGRTCLASMPFVAREEAGIFQCDGMADLLLKGSC